MGGLEKVVVIDVELLDDSINDESLVSQRLGEVEKLVPYICVVVCGINVRNTDHSFEGRPGNDWKRNRPDCRAETEEHGG